MKIETILTPAELPALAQRDLSQTVCVVFDILRATSTMVTALANSAAGVAPAAEIAEALDFKNSEFGIRNSEFILLAGEREGVRIRGALSGGVDFDLGNSPREFTPEKVRGKIIVSTTTNGTRALRACAGAKLVLAGAFLNLTATAALLKKLSPENLLLVGSGTREEEALEDTLAAGALLEIVAPRGWAAGSSVERAVKLWERHKADLVGAMQFSTNGRRLLAMSDLRDDVDFCLRRDVFDLTAVLGTDGVVRRRADAAIS